MHYSVTVHSVQTAAVVDTWETIMALIVANTAGHRARLRSLTIGGGGAAVQDIQVAFRLIRTNNATPGTPGSSPTPKPKDPASLAAKLTAGVAYSAEPTVLETTEPFVYQGSINGRGEVIKEWPGEDAPVIPQNTTLCLQATPGAATAVNLTATMEFEEY